MPQPSYSTTVGTINMTEATKGIIKGNETRSTPSSARARCIGEPWRFSLVNAPDPLA